MARSGVSGRSPVPTHSCALNLMLLSAPPARDAELLERVAPKIEELRDRYLRPATVEWLPGLRRWSQWPSIKRFYNPRTYSCLGAFDVATIYLSPAISQPLPPADQFPGTGQHVHMCLLPTLARFNSDFIDFYSTPADGERLPPAQRFLAIVKLKMNLLVTWPDRRSRSPYGRFISVMEGAVERIEEWRSRRGSPAPLAALGLGSGWSELLVIAHSDSIGSLIELIWSLRAQTGRAYGCSKEQAHAFATSISHVAYDHRMAVDARRIYQETLKKAAGALSGADVLEMAERLSREYSRAAMSAGSPFPVYVNPAYSAYPGHESLLSRMIHDALSAPGWKRYPATLSRSLGQLGHLGEYDLSGPMLHLADGFDDTLAILYANLLSAWLLRGGVDPFIDERRGLTNFFKSNTAAGLVGLGDHEGFAIPDGHFESSPEDQPGQGALLLERRLVAVLTATIEPMRRLQIPYSRTEQVSNLIAKFLWTTKHDVLWEDALCFAPLVFCLSEHLRSLYDWWKKASFQDWQGPLEEGADTNPQRRTAQEIRRRLLELNSRSLPELLAAFRASFHHRHLGGYLTDQTPDFNLRYRGSVQQLLNITNMSLDAMVAVLLGDRACVATIGDSPTPEVSVHCDVVVAKLHADTITTPILLETLAHEVGNLLVPELLAASAPPSFAGEEEIEPNRWAVGAASSKTYVEAATAAGRVRTEIYYSQTPDPSGYFVETSSDLVEVLLLGYESVEEWVKSFTLRQLLASPAVSQDVKEDRLEEERTEDPDPLVPSPDKDVMKKALIRAVQVRVAWALLEDAVPEDYSGYIEGLRSEALARLRRVLYEQCTVGPSQELAKNLRDEARWSTFVDEAFRWAPWLLDRPACLVAQRFFRALRDHIAAGQKQSSGSVELWNAILAEYKALRGSLLPLLEPCLHVRHWLSAAESAGGVEREEIESENRPEKYPWRVVPQPLEVHDQIASKIGGGRPVGDLEIQLLVMQRGRIAPMNPTSGERLRKANNRFLSTMIAMLPAWRRSVYDRIVAIEGESAVGS